LDDPLKGLSNRITIPSIDKMKLESFEAPVIVGSIPAGFGSSGFKVVWSYTQMNIMLGFHRMIRRGGGTAFGSAQVETAYKRRCQPWDMGGAYLDLEDVPFDEGMCH
jgi:hypothetical protein